MFRRALLVLLMMFSNGSHASAPSLGTRLYVTNEFSGDLTVIDVGLKKVIARIPLGKRPRGIVPGPEGKLLYIALSGSPVGGPGVEKSTLPPRDKSADGIAVFDVLSGRVIRMFRGVSDPETLAVSPDGDSLYVASEDTGQLVVMDARNGTIRANVPVGGEAEGTAISPDGSLVYVSSEEDHTVAVFETGKGTVRKRIRVGMRPRNIAFSADGDRAYVPGENDGSISVINVGEDRVIDSVKLPGENARPMGIAFSPDGKDLFVTTGRGRNLVRLDPATLRVTGEVEVGERPWGIALSPDGRFLFTANGPSNDVTMVDAKSLAVITHFPAGDRPWGAVVVTVR